MARGLRQRGGSRAQSVLTLLIVPLLGAVAPGQPRTSLPPTFTRDIAPIVFAQCVSCHRPDGPAPFGLTTYGEVRRRARQIAAVTKSRTMPPWKPEPGFGEFENSRRLSDADIDLIGQWADEGAAEGDASDLPPLPRWAPGWQLGEPDLVVSLPEYTLRAEGADVFRTFVVPIPGTGMRYVRASEFRPGSQTIHHANIRFDSTPASRMLDESDPEPGYDGLIASSAEYPDGHFNGWTPGQVPSPSPKGLAWRLPSGVDLVVNLHLRPTGKQERVHPAVGFFFTDEAPTRTPALVRLGRQDLDIPAGDAAYPSMDSYVLPVDTELHVIQPHAHYRPRELKVQALLPDGTARWLLYIADWDFNWQEPYRYKTPFWLPAGTRLVAQYLFDNSATNVRNPQSPPSRVSWGFGSSDEMGDVWIQMFTRTDADLDRLMRDVRSKMAADAVVGNEILIRADPDNAGLHNDAALLYMQLGKLDRALAHFEEVTRIRPASAAARFNAGTILESMGRIPEAAARYDAALRLDPGYAPAHNSLGNVRLAQEKLVEATAHYRDAIRLKPDYAEAHNNLATVLIAANPERGNELDEAIGHLRRALELRSRYPAAHFNIARALRRQGDTPSAILHYRDALADAPDCAPCLIELSWVLATDAEATVRDPREAIGLATRAAQITRSGDPFALDALAAAYAASGRFEEAVATASQAVNLAAAAPVKGFDLTAQIRERLSLYRTNRSFVERAAK